MAQQFNFKVPRFKSLWFCAVFLEVLFLWSSKTCFFSPGFTGVFIAASNPKNLHWSHVIFSIQFHSHKSFCLEKTF